MATDEKRNSRGDTLTEAKMRRLMDAIDSIRTSGHVDAHRALQRVIAYAIIKQNELIQEGNNGL